VAATVFVVAATVFVVAATVFVVAAVLILAVVVGVAAVSTGAISAPGRLCLPIVPTSLCARTPCESGEDQPTRFQDRPARRKLTSSSA
jgi:hypothetical protein